MKTIANKVQLIGNLGKDPEVKDLSSGKTIAKLAIATNETYKTAAGERVKETQWHNLVAWGPQAKFARQYLHKGMRIGVEGRLQNRSFEGKDGNKRYVTEVVVDSFMRMDSRKEEAALAN